MEIQKVNVTLLKVNVTLLKEPDCDLVVKVEEKYNFRNYDNLMYIRSRSKYVKEIYGDQFHNKKNFYHEAIKKLLVGDYINENNDLDLKLNNNLLALRINTLLSDNKPVNLILDVEFEEKPIIFMPIKLKKIEFSKEDKEQQLKKFESYCLKDNELYKYNQSEEKAGIRLNNTLKQELRRIKLNIDTF